MESVTNLTLGSSCNLTLASKLKLESSVQAMLHRFRVVLSRTQVDIDEVKEIEDTLEFLNKYINVECLASAVDEVKQHIREHVSLLRETINTDLIARGKQGAHCDP